MLTRRFYSALFFAVAVFFAQQGSALHALRHAMAEQVQKQNKQAPTTHDCEQCLCFSQIGGALGSSYLTFALHTALSHALVTYQHTFAVIPTLTATARGPPALYSTI